MVGHGSFRFQNVWISHRKFLSVVRESWDQPVRGRGMEAFCQKLVALSRKLRSWNLQAFGNIQRNIQEAQDEMQWIQTIYDQQGGDVYRSQLSEARARHARLLAIENDFWRQKAAIKWLKQGEANTAFFHVLVRERRNRNYIARIKDDNDGWVELPSAIQDLTVEFFW